MFEVLYIEIKINNDYYIIKDRVKIENILRIIRTWPKRLYSNHVLDGEDYTINVVEKYSNTLYQGQGTFPKNYFKLKQIISDANA